MVINGLVIDGPKGMGADRSGFQSVHIPAKLTSDEWCLIAPVILAPACSRCPREIRLMPKLHTVTP